MHVKGIFLLTGAQQNKYRVERGKGICCIISARNLKSSKLHIKYKESSSSHNAIKIFWKKKKNIKIIINYKLYSNITMRFDNAAFGK